MPAFSVGVCGEFRFRDEWRAFMEGKVSSALASTVMYSLAMEMEKLLLLSTYLSIGRLHVLHESLLGHSSLVQHDIVVCVFDGLQPMRDGDYGRLPHFLA